MYDNMCTREASHKKSIKNMSIYNVHTSAFNVWMGHMYAYLCMMYNVRMYTSVYVE